MTVITSNFVSGVAEDLNGIFSGIVEPFAGDIMGTLATMFDVKGMPSYETDAFEWRPDVLTMKTGFGKTIPGQPRISYEFKCSVPQDATRNTLVLTFQMEDHLFNQ